MRILFDTNVILDFIVERPPFSSSAEKAIELCMGNGIQSCIAAHTISNLFYILRKDVAVDDRRRMLLRLCQIFTVIGIDVDKLKSALNNSGFKDFEDCLHAECAVDFKADYIVTRNIKDFINSAIPSIEPDELIKRLSAQQ